MGFIQRPETIRYAAFARQRNALQQAMNSAASTTAQTFALGPSIAMRGIDSELRAITGPITLREELQRETDEWLKGVL